MIAIQKLREVRKGLALAGRNLRVRCLFIEKDPRAFERLRHATESIADFELPRTLNGEFEQLIPDILSYVGSAFSLVFIDPTGWTGFRLNRIAPFLRHQPGEVLVNFMFDHINRFLNDPRPETAATFEELIGGPDWEDLAQSPRREGAIVELYRERMRKAGNFPHVTSTRILKPLSDRAYFHLIYGTRHPKGLVEFRAIEAKTVLEQDDVRRKAKQAKRVDRTKQNEMFLDASLQGSPDFTAEQEAQLQKASVRLRELLHEKRRVPYEMVQAAALEIPLVSNKHLGTLVMEMKTSGEILIPGMGRRERTPKVGHVLVLKTTNQ